MPSIAADPGYRGVGHGWWVWLGRGGVVGAVGF